MAPSTGSGWTPDEDLIVVDTYRSLWLDQSRGRPIDIGGAIRDIAGVDKEFGAIRMRMSNISGVLERHGITPVSGLAPLRNAAKQTQAMVAASLPWN